MKFKLPFRKKAAQISVIRLNGAISSGRGLNDQALAKPIERAFKRKKLAAVALQINSPGGSPVQSSLIAARIRRLAAEHEVPVLAFVEDVAASGGYWLACAGDEIYADVSSIVGSIGVIFANFGFDRFIEHHGVERRVYTSGESKSQLDPFKPENPEDVARIKALGGEIHEAFIEHVKAARGAKLVDNARLFSGEFWTGKKAVELGLIDGIAHMVPALKARFGDDVRFRVFSVKKSFFSRFGARVFGEAIGAIEERSLWWRYGL